MDSTNRKFVIIDVDVNDGDIESAINEITEEQAMAVSRVAAALKEFKPYETEAESMTWKHEHNFPTGNKCRTHLGELPPEEYYLESGLILADDFSTFLNLTPYTEYGFHTVTGIKILAVIGEIKLL